MSTKLYGKLFSAQKRTKGPLILGQHRKNRHANQLRV